ncbi:MAG: hypothetical protein ACRDTJ_17620, partial [Pseudonocardiaceae bacterium]
MIAARTDVVGSLLRPRELLEARKRLERGEIGAPEFKRVEDAAVRLQEGVGLAVVTDGEIRRLSFQSQLTEAVEASATGISTRFCGATGTATRSETNASSARRSPCWAGCGAA